MNLEQKLKNFCPNNLVIYINIKNLPSGDFFIQFNTNTLKIIQQLSINIVWKHQNSFYICNRLVQIIEQ